MGLLDLPAPLLSWIDRHVLDALPLPARLVLWAAVAAVLSMELYRIASPQRRVSRLIAALGRARARLAAFDGPFEDAWPKIRRTLSLAWQRVVLVVPASVLASLPLLVIVVWLNMQYGRAFPPQGEPVSITAPGAFHALWIDEGDDTPRARIVDPDGVPVAELTVAAPIPVIHKRRWWNTLIGNPAGYLPADAPVERIDLALPRQQVLAIGPDPMRGWELPFFFALVSVALTHKIIRRIR